MTAMRAGHPCPIAVQRRVTIACSGDCAHDTLATSPDLRLEEAQRAHGAGLAGRNRTCI
jgi:hypothetical protein